MAETDKNQMSAADLISSSQRRDEKSAADLGYSTITNLSSTKPTTYTANSSYKSITENTDVTKQLKHSDEDD